MDDVAQQERNNNIFVRIGRDGLTKLSIEKVWFDLDVREMLLCNSPLHQQPGDRKNK